MVYRPEIDGLRAIAVIPVIFFHAGFKYFSGGFVGVDVFFVISGYLITSIIINDIYADKFSIADFYARRARRILPALFFIALACIPFAWIWMLPNQMKDFSDSLIAISLFSSNILFWRTNDYFDDPAEEMPLLHTWSLSVEEQYYLFFPFFICFLWKLGRDRVFWFIIIALIISLTISEWGWRNKASANFYLAPTRAWELLSGSVAAFIATNRSVKPNNIISAAGFSGIVVAILIYGEETPFPSLYAGLPVISTILILLFADESTIVGKLLRTKPLVGVGLISYSAYLWHQPLFAFARIRILEPNPETFYSLIVATFILAFLTWKCIEKPFRSFRPQNISTLFVSVVAALFFIGFGFAGHFTNGFSSISKARSELATYSSRLGANFGMSSDCEGQFTLSANCANSKSPSVLLWGDSFAMHLFHGLIASEPSIQIRQLTQSSCSPILGVAQYNPMAGKDRDWSKECNEFNLLTFRWLESNTSIEFVVLSSPFGWVGQSAVFDVNGSVVDSDLEMITAKFADTIAKIKSLGVGVVVVSPTPHSGHNTGRCVAKMRQYQDIPTCDFRIPSHGVAQAFLESAASFVPIYSLEDDICFDGWCAAEVGDVFIYRDGGHLSKEGSAYLGLKNGWHDQFRALALQSKTSSDLR